MHYQVIDLFLYSFLEIIGFLAIELSFRYFHIAINFFTQASEKHIGHRISEESILFSEQLVRKPAHYGTEGCINGNGLG